MIDVAILIVFILCILAGYYRGTIYAAINIGITVLSFFLARLMVPAAAGIVKKSDTLYKGMLYYFEGYEYISASSVERVHDIATATPDEELDYLIENANMPLPFGKAVWKNIHGLAYAKKGIVTLGDYFNQTIVDVVINILSLLLLFIIIRLAIGWALSAADFSVGGLPVMKRYDALFSCGIGFLHGVVLLYIIFLIVPVVLAVVPRIGNYLEASKLGGFFYHMNPLLWMIPTT